MVTPRKRGGYVWKQEMGRALRTNNTARQAIRCILDERPGPTLTALYLAEAALALGENLEALRPSRSLTVRKALLLLRWRPLFRANCRRQGVIG